MPRGMAADCDWTKAKHERCVRKVKASNRRYGRRANPYAVCNATCLGSTRTSGRRYGRWSGRRHHKRTGPGRWGPGTTRRYS